ncbi:MAG: prolyl oligopeptidase family serine peptidase [Candidatus Dormiibacterota bacterium]
MGLTSRRLRVLCAGAIAAVGLALLPAGASAGATTVLTGTTTEASGLVSHYLIEVPDPWNGTLVLYSHGYQFAAADPPDAGDPGTRGWLLAHGYALAGSSYATTGWALQQAFQDQIAVLDVFDSKFRHPDRTIAWGHSLGGMITAGLVQLFANRFTAALPMCGVVAGGPGVWNQGLDSEFALQTLQPEFKHVKLVDFMSIGDAAANFGVASSALAAAQKSAEGRARIALGSALADVPGWFDPASPEPAANDYAAQEMNQVQWDNNPDFYFGFFGRFELESKFRAGGNFSWNTGVDYRVQLSHSTDFAEVKALYSAAGLDLNAELDQLNNAPRISADPSAVAYVSKYITYNGSLNMPVLTMHTTGDGLVEVTDENAYASVVRSAGDNSMLRQVFVHRAGHCSFSPAETISAFQTLVHRLDTGRWEDSTNPVAMNSTATSLGSAFNVTVAASGAIVPAAASFIKFQPDKFLRPFDARDVA